MTDSDSIEFTAHDLQSTMAGKLRRHVEARRQALRVKNDGDLDSIATAKVRGEIKAYKDLKNLFALSKKTDQTMVADDAPGE